MTLKVLRNGKAFDPSESNINVRISFYTNRLRELDIRTVSDPEDISAISRCEERLKLLREEQNK